MFTALVYYSLSSYIPERHPFISNLESLNITHAEFICKSNPEKRGDVYVVLAQCTKVYKKDTSEEFSSQASGTVLLYVPSSIVESYYPGKLYSKTSSKAIFEKGSIIYSAVKVFITKSNSTAFRIESASQLNWTSKVSCVRALLRLQFKRLMYAWDASGGLLLALLCGSREYLEEDVSIGFRNAGLAHILALSGMHLSFFSGISTAVSKKIAGKKGSLIFSFVSVLLFVWFACFSPSLLKSLFVFVTVFSLFAH